MRKYYYSNGKDRVGPVTLSELKSVRGLSPETLVWYEGLSTWLRAGDIAELSDVFVVSAPPPLSSSASSGSVPLGRLLRDITSHGHSLEGRIRRQEYVISLLLYALLSIFCQWAWSGDDTSELSFDSITYWLCILALWWYAIAQTTKRSHDIGKSGWWQLIPFYNLYLLFAVGDCGANEYGSDPKGE